MCTVMRQVLLNGNVGSIAICWDGKCNEDRQPALTMAKVKSSFLPMRNLSVLAREAIRPRIQGDVGQCE